MKNNRTYPVIFLLGVIVILISCKKETSCEGCAIKKNKTPISVAGPDQVITLPADSVLLDGSASSDPDGIISSYLWTKIAGPASFNIVNSTDSITKLKTLVAGIYQFELKITDNGGLSVKDTIKIIVDPVLKTNHPPIANAGTNQTITLPANAVNLDGRASTDPENNIKSYKWTKISGPSSFTITNGNIVQTQVTNLVQGIYQFELKVTDESGLFSYDTMMVLVNSSTIVAPVINAGPDIIITLPLDSIYLFGSTSVWPVTFDWTQISGPSTALIGASNVGYYQGSAILAKELIQGLYSFRVQAGNSGGVSFDTVNVLVINDPQDLNTITFKNLKWILADEYGIGYTDLSLRLPALPNLFFQSGPGIPWQLIAFEIYLQTDAVTQWINLNVAQPALPYYAYDTAMPNVWIMRIPVDSTWVGKESTVKIKLL